MQLCSCFFHRRSRALRRLPSGRGRLLLRTAIMKPERASGGFIRHGGRRETGITRSRKPLSLSWFLAWSVAPTWEAL